MQKEYSVYRRNTTTRVLKKEKEDCEVMLYMATNNFEGYHINKGKDITGHV